MRKSALLWRSVLEGKLEEHAPVFFGDWMFSDQDYNLGHYVSYASGYYLRRVFGLAMVSKFGSVVACVGS